jgi:hypothetical protein
MEMISTMTRPIAVKTVYCNINKTAIASNESMDNSFSK